MGGDNFERFDILFLWSLVGVVLVHFVLMGTTTALQIAKKRRSLCRVEKIDRMHECSDSQCRVTSVGGFEGYAANPMLGDYARICADQEN